MGAVLEKHSWLWPQISLPRQRALFSVNNYMNYLPQVSEGYLEIFEFTPAFNSRSPYKCPRRPYFFYTLNFSKGDSENIVSQPCPELSAGLSLHKPCRRHV